MRLDLFINCSSSGCGYGVQQLFILEIRDGTYRLISDLGAFGVDFLSKADQRKSRLIGPFIHISHPMDHR